MPELSSEQKRRLLAERLRRQAGGSPFPLSHGQRALWFLYRLAPESSAYNLCFTARLRGEVDAGALAQAFGDLVARHPMLRTVFMAPDDEPLQRVQEGTDLRMEVIDAAGWTDAAVEAWLDAECARPFDLERGPVFRAALLERGAEAPVLVFGAHHIASDFWSLAMILQDLGRFYEARLTGGEAALPPAPPPYAEFVRWQAAMLAGPEGERHWAYWRDQLGGSLPELELPTDRQRGTSQSFRGAALQVGLGRELTAGLRSLARRRGTTLYVVLLAGFEALLARHSGQLDFVVGSMVAGRSRSRFARVVGYFTNAVALRCRLDGDPAVAELVERAQARVLGALGHQDYPFPLLVDRLGVRREGGRSPVFQTSFALEKVQNPELEGASLFSFGQEGGRLRIGRLDLESLARREQAVQFDLSLVVEEVGGRLRGFFQYSTDLFEPSTIGRLAGHLETLLARMVEDPAARLAELPLLTARELHQVLLAWNDTASPYPSGACVHELFTEWAARAPARTALVCGRERLTYGELDERAGRLARCLAALGAGPESRIGLCLPRSPDLVVAMLAVLRAGGAYVPLDPGYPAERLAVMAEEARISVLLTVGELGASLPVTDRIALDGEWWRTADAAPDLAPPAGPDQLAYVMFTSGSTGRPKGVGVPHRGIVRLVRDTWYADLSPDEVFLLLAPASFDASTLEIWGPLLNGGRLVIMPPRTPSFDEIAQAVDEHGVTFLHLTAALFHRMAEGWSEALVSVPQLLTGGDVVSAPHVERLLARRLPGTRLVHCYGPTENTTFTCCHVLRPGDPVGASLPIGRPLANTHVHVLDGALRPVPASVVGELYTGGQGLARGYVNGPHLTAERVIPDPLAIRPGGRLYRTGDLVRRDARGAIEFLGRIDGQVKIRGFRIELAEIEAALNRHPGLRNAAVVARGEGGDRSLVAYVVPRQAPVGVAELREHLRKSLPDHMVPRTFVTLADLPVTENGKVDRRALPAPVPGRAELTEAFVAPRTPAEEALAGIWREVLDLDRVGVNDNFFELGGDSILALQVVGRAGRSGLRLSPHHVLQHQTVAELAQAARTVEPPAAAVEDRVGPRPLAPIQRRFFAQDPPAPHHHNQSLWLEATEPLRPPALDLAWRSVVAHHDALRSRFRRVAAGWEATVAGSDEAAGLCRIDLSALPEAASSRALPAAVLRLQGSLDLARGPLTRLALIHRGGERPDALLWLAHHLVVDGVSWRILFADLETAYRQAARGEPVRLPEKTTSFRRWCDLLVEHTLSGFLDAELPAWLERPGAEPLPLDGPDGGADTVSSEEAVTVALGADETRALLQDVPAAYRTRIDDALLTALLEAFCAWTGARALLVDLEGHGRESGVVAPEIDLSHTIGWFTAVYPVVLELPRESGPGAALRAVKERLRAVPSRGLGYGMLRYLRGGAAAEALAALPQAQVSFNYLGRLDGLAGGAAPWRPRPEPVEGTRGPGNPRSHRIEIDAWVVEGRLRLRWTFSRNRHRPATIAGLAERFLERLRDLIRHCLSAEAGGLTPSDVPLAGLDQRRLDLLVAGDRRIEDVYALAPMQRGLLFHALLAPVSGVYFVQAVCELRDVDPAALRRAWQIAVDRHPVLRTSFAWQGLDEPLQLVRREVEVPWREEDWRGGSPAELRRRMDSYLERDRGRPFDLGQPPLLRLALVRVAEDAYRLIWSSHHTVLDGWSKFLVLAEVLVLHDVLRRGEEPRPEPLPPYRAYVEALRRQDLAAAEAFWRGLLAGVPAAARVPGDLRGATGGAEETDGRRDLQLSRAATEALQAGARQARVTLSDLVQGAWAIVLSRYSGQTDVAYGLTVSGRSLPLARIESMVGLFINTVPVRLDAGAGEPVAGWLRGLQAQRAAAAPHEHAPLIRIQEWSGLPRGAHLFQSLVLFENYPVDDVLRAGGGAVAGLRIQEQTNYPLTVTIAPGEVLAVRLLYDRRSFSPALVTRLLRHFETVLAGMVADPRRRPSEVPWLTPAERQQVLREWTPGPSGPPEPARVHELVAAQAARTPEAVAVVCGDERLTYRDLVREAGRLAAALSARGVGPEVPVGIFVERSPRMVVAMLGVLEAGGAYVPLDPAYPEERLAHMIEDSGAPLVLTERDLLERLPRVASSALCLDGGELAVRNGAPPASRVTGDLAYVIYTSGSTGRPKGVMVGHAGVVGFLRSMARRPGLSAADTLVSVTTLSFDIAALEIFLPLAVGARLVLASREVAMDGRRLAALLEECGATVMQATPATWRMLVATGWRGDGRLTMLCGGEALPRDLADRLLERGGRLWNLYGPTETTIWSAVHEVPPGPEPVSVGRPIRNTAIHVLGAALGPSPAGVAGEVYIGGDGLARGYHGRPGLTAERFLPDPHGGRPGARLYRVGDVGRFTPAGELELSGRVDHQVKLRGFRIELGEIEAVLGRHPGVGEAVVALREDAPGDRRLVAYLVPGSGPAPDAGELRELARRSLPEHMVPSAFVSLPALPRTPNGKLDRAALPAPDGRRRSGAPSGAPRSNAERTIAAVWQEVLRVGAVGREESFFDLGGDSFLAVTVYGKLRELFDRELTMVDLFRYPTVAALAAFLAGDERPQPRSSRAAPAGAAGSAIAVVGLSGRFPGADDIEAFWRLLEDGAEGISVFTDEELLASGVDPDLMRRPEYVRAGGVIPGEDLFDAAFFGFTPREAEIMDPQHRLFLECAWHALEDAGCDPARFPGRIGLFAGVGINSYLPLVAGSGQRVERIQLLIGNDKDFVPTRVSYKLDLRGPSLSVQTACSSSLVAVHLACQSLLLGESDAALAGGVAMRVPQRVGYLHQPGGIPSADGHCRAFDAAAGGTVFGNGVGLVVLKRLADAIADRDAIRAVIKGSAINNDGAHKVGFTAPSVEGQAQVIREALAMADFPPESIGYVEAHGTGTELGDPIELSALAQAFGDRGEAHGRCAVGSVKTNIGHLDTAAGVAGLIKAVLALERECLPASLHFTAPNPSFDLAASPFRVNVERTPWPRGAAPRRAGVSSFGIGGTNAHAVLEEAPVEEPSSGHRSCQLLLLSARTETALAALGRRLAGHLREHPKHDLADVAFTCQVGRRRLEHRLALVCRDRESALAALATPESTRGVHRDGGSRPVVFMFSGQGAQRPGMGAGLYRAEPAFREALDLCSETLVPHLGVDLRQVLYPPADEEERAGARLDRTAVAQPALFAVEYALARLWMDWGVRPEAMIGHSIGEYVAACLSGVLSLGDALAVVAARGRLMEALPEGAMLAVPLPEPEVRRLAAPPLSLAAVNAPRRSVVSGPEAAVTELAERLGREGVVCRRLRTSHAFHSGMMEPAAASVADLLSRVRLSAPSIPYVSNVTGTWIRPEEATSPAYWADHLLRTVLFGDGLAELLGEPDRVLLEIGSGDALTGFAAQAGGADRAVASLPRRAALGETGELGALLQALGRLWVAGVAVDWQAFTGRERRRRVPLPGYPFERKRFWIAEASPTAQADASLAASPPGPPARPLAGERVRSRLRSIFRSLTGLPEEEIRSDVSFLELGADSIVLLQAAAALKEAFGVEVSLRQLFGELSTLDELATHLEGLGLPDHAHPGPAPATATSPAGRSAVFVPFQPIQAPDGVELDERQRAHVAALAARYTGRTAGSKRLTQEHRRALADNRQSAGFRLSIKEMLYPIVSERSSGSRIWDVDGNEYIDLAMGFGVHLFGHGPRFVQEALAGQLERGIQLGPQSHLAGEVAELICTMTGMERVAFSNTGTEAVMTALRVARAVTGRPRIALFTGSYHGHSDVVLASPSYGGDRSISHPMAPGVSAGAASEVLALDYADPRSLDLLRAHASELAAVLVEPVQSRRPDLQPREFLGELRELTRRFGIALIFDEMITGFRCHPGGAQAWFGVEADIATYGKVIGGGMPVGVVAGRGAYMDAIDGGQWGYGDGSFPQARTTFFSGTFCKHPLAMAAARAVLRHLGDAGPALQEELNARTSRLAADLNAFFAAEEVPIRTVSFGSLFRFAFEANLDLLFYHLADRGIYTWEGRNLFLSTAHGDEDVQAIQDAVRASVEELRQGGFLPERAGVRGGREVLRAPSAEAQREAWNLAQVGPEASAALNSHVCLRLRGVLRRDVLQGAIDGVVARHEALRTVFADEGRVQEILPEAAVPLAETDLAAGPGAPGERVAAWLAEESRRPFDLARGPLVRAALLTLGAEENLLVLGFHQSVADGWSIGVVLRETLALYEAGWEGRPAALPEPARFRDYVERGRRRVRDPATEKTLGSWLDRLRPPLAPLALPTDRPRRPLPTYAGATVHAQVEEALWGELQGTASRLGASPSMLLLAAFGALLHRLSGQDDVVVLMPTEGQAIEGTPCLVGDCVNLVPLRTHAGGDPTFSSYLAQVRQTLIEALERPYPFADLVQRLQPPPDPGRWPLFNLDRPMALPAPHGLEIDLAPMPRSASSFELALNAVPDDGLLRLIFDFKAELFDRSTVERWAGSLVDLLRRVAAHPEARLSALPSPGEPEGARAPGADGAATEPARPFTAPATAVEERLAEIWGEVLCHDRVSVEDGFFALGGHSLLLTRVVSRIRDAFGIELPLRSLLDAPTISELAPRVEAALRAGGREAALPLSRAPAGADLPLSAAQLRMWLSAQLDPASPAWNVPMRLRVTGRLDLALLARTLSEIVRRHAVLRTTFHLVDGRPVQVIEGAAPVPLPVIDLAALDSSRQQEETRRITRLEMRRPFDLGVGPLLRVCVLRLAGTEQLLMLAMHHIVTDAWSSMILESEVMALYRAFLAGEPSPLPELALQYADFAYWQHRWLQGDALAAQRDYWRSRLANPPQLLPLPFDRPRTEALSAPGGIYPVLLPAKLARAVKAVADAESATLFMALLALFEALLHRVTGQSDLVVGTDVANRNRTETEGLLGFFVNVLALRVRVTPGLSFRELLRRTRETAIQAFENQDLPFEEVLRELRSDNGAGRPLFNVFFLLEDAAETRLDLPGMAVTPASFANQVALRDLSLYATEQPEGVLCTWHFRSDLFDPATIEGLARSFLALAESATTRPDTRLEDLALVGEAERGQNAVERERRERRAAARFKTVKPKAVDLEVTRDAAE